MEKDTRNEVEKQVLKDEITRLHQKISEIPRENMDARQWQTQIHTRDILIERLKKKASQMSKEIKALVIERDEIIQITEKDAAQVKRLWEEVVEKHQHQKTLFETSVHGKKNSGNEYLKYVK